jgi:peptidoglycan-associated lipoprotein
MARWQAVVLGTVMAVALTVGGAPPAGADQVWLRNGGMLQGDLDLGELVVETPTGSYRVARERVWRLVFDAGPADDSVDLRNGSRISGRVDRGPYALRVAGGETRQLERGDIAVIALSPPRTPSVVRRTDVLILRNGDHVLGEVSPREFDITIPTGTQRFGRPAVWQLELDSVKGDTIWLGDGGRLSGNIEVPRYEVRTQDGQSVGFARDEVLGVVFETPLPPHRAAPAGPAVAVAPPAATAPAPGPGAGALPPALRAVLRDLQFEFDRWDLTPEARRSLDELAAALKGFPGLRLVIEGHADERGTTEYNLALGARRAQSARDYLVSLGIAADRLETTSYGEERPLDPAHNEMAWALNRRAHFVVKAP